MTSDHFDGRRFFNPSGAPAGKSIWQLLRWKLGPRGKPWPRHVENETYPSPPTAVRPGEVAATFIGQATWLLRFAGVVILTDPVWSRVAGPAGRFGPARVRPPGLPFDRLPRVDVVLVSHNHYDHLDVPTLQRLDRGFGPRFVTGLGNDRFLRRKGLRDVTALDWWESTEPLPGVVVTMTPAQHFSARTPFDKNRTLWGGFHIKAGGVSLYFAADTGYDAAIFRAVREKLGPPDLALLPIGAYAPRWFMRSSHMDPGEAVQAFLETGAAAAAGFHFDTFPLADEPFGEAPDRLSAELAARGVPADRFWVPGFGETSVIR